MKAKFFRTLRLLGLLYALVCVLVGVFQRRIIYFPFYKTEAGMLAEADRLGCEPWRDATGAIIGWKSARNGRSGAQNRLLLLHGNTGYALHRTQYLEGFQQLEGGRLWEVYLFEYPGFGARAGSLGQEPFITAGLQALETLRAADARPIFLLGESLGSGLASALAQRKSALVAGLFVFTPYARMSDVAAQRFGFLPVRLMLRDPWDNVAALREYHGPMAMLIAERDEVVTAAQGQLLFDGYAGPKRLWIEPGATHNTVDFRASSSWWWEVSEFLLHPVPGAVASP